MHYLFIMLQERQEINNERITFYHTNDDCDSKPHKINGFYLCVSNRANRAK